MKSSKPLLLSAVLFAMALAGCADDPASGEFSSTTSGLTIDGAVTFTYTEAENPYDSGQDPPEGVDPDQACDLDAATGGVPGAPTCTPASTNITVMLHSVTDPQENPFEVFLVGPGERALGSISMGTDGMWVMETSIEGENLEGMYNSTELRYGDYVLAVAGTNAGANTFEIASDARVSYTASYAGSDLSINVTGLQDGVPYTAWLVNVDEETGEKTHDESFTVTAGDNSYTASVAVDQFEELHIHVGTSKLNPAIGEIT